MTDEVSEFQEIEGIEKAKDERFFSFDHCLDLFLMYKPYTFFNVKGFEYPRCEMKESDFFGCWRSILKECCYGKSEEILRANDEYYKQATGVYDKAYQNFAASFERVFYKQYQTHRRNPKLIGEIWKDYATTAATEISRIVNEVCIDNEAREMEEIDRRRTEGMARAVAKNLENR
ncbi:TPA: hypothetical protein ACXK4S_000681 [Pseudomonas aeruginosa]